MSTPPRRRRYPTARPPRERPRPKTPRRRRNIYYLKVCTNTVFSTLHYSFARARLAVVVVDVTSQSTSLTMLNPRSSRSERSRRRTAIALTVGLALTTRRAFLAHVDAGEVDPAIDMVDEHSDN